MKKFLLLLTLAFLFGCAQKIPEFIPLSVNWYGFEGDVQAVNPSYKPAEIDSTLEEACLISMTRTLMEDKVIQEKSKNGKEFNVQYLGVAAKEGSALEFRGQCANPEDNTDFEKAILFFVPEKNCNLTARCEKGGKIQNLKIF